MAQRPPLWEAPVAFVLSSLEKAGIPIAERRFEAEETIYIRGDPAQYLYFVTEGVIKLYKSYGGHKEAIVALLEEGNVFGVPDLRARSAHCDSAEAVVRSRIAIVDKFALGEHVRRDPKCALALLIVYAQWVQRRERTAVRLAHRDTRSRLASVLLELVDRFGEPRENEVAIQMRLPHLMLAEMSASSRVGVSKEMARFCREGVIKKRGKSQIVLLDQPRLAQITGNR
jgi:CRP/FNR family transcriptional regulator, anaerobic regulatory protein